MMAFVLYQPFYFVLLALVPALLFLFYRSAMTRKRAIKKLFPHREEFVFRQLNNIRRYKMGLSMMVLLMMIIALTRPAWNLKLTKSIRQGRDIVILLDVSRSMLAEDVYPNRLESAKESIIEFSEQLHGDRIALVVFAGASQISCPLTFDYAFFKNVVHDIDWQSASVGGTYLSTGLKRVTKDLLSAQKQAEVDLIVISDGGDMGDLDSIPSFFKNNRINLISIGTGDPGRAAMIPDYKDENDELKTYLKHKGIAVTSSLQAASLKKLADITDGTYVEPGTQALNLMQIYQAHKKSDQQQKQQGSEISSFKEQFQWFIILAIIFLFVLIGIPRKIKNKTFSLLALITLCSLLSCSPDSQSSSDHLKTDIKTLYKKGYAHYRDKAFSLARYSFTSAWNNAKTKDQKAQLAYNLGNCYFNEAYNIEIEDEEEEDIDINELMLYNFGESERFFRIAFTIDPDLQDACYNFEIVRAAKMKLLEEIRKNNALNQEMTDPVKEIIERLTLELEMQQKVNNGIQYYRNNSGSRRNNKKMIQQNLANNTPDRLSKKQTELCDTTRMILLEIWELEHLSDSLTRGLDMPVLRDTSYQIPIRKMDSVLWLQDSIADQTLRNIRHQTVQQNTRTVINLIQQTIDYFNEAFNQDPNMPEGQSQSKDGESSDESSDSDEDELTESENMNQNEMNQAKEMEGFPPPNDNAKDILKQEQKNNQARSKKKARYKRVEKDW